LARRAARRRLLRLRRASGCLGTSRGLSRGSSRCSSSTTPPRAGSPSTTSPTPHVRVPRHVAWLATWLVTPLVVNYSTSCRLVVDYFAYAARPGASARRAARRRLLCLRCASGCLCTLRFSSRRSSSTTPPRAGSSSTTSPTPRVQVPWHVGRLVTSLVVDYSTLCRLIVDYFAYAARPGASARRVARHAASRAARR
jgi:hypothetical protein